MTSLEDKLFWILDEALQSADTDKGKAELIAQIKQAFAEEGSRKMQLHVKTRLMTHKGYDELNKTWTPQVLVPRNKLHISLDAYDKSFVEIELKNEGDDLMTGQEWYERFKKEYQAMEGHGVYFDPDNAAYKAAERASS